MDGYSHLSNAEREDIMVRWEGHEGVGRIAGELHRDKPAISREIRRNGWQGPAGRRHRASTAQGKADGRRLRRRRPGLMDEPERRSPAVGPMRDERWSLMWLMWQHLLEQIYERIRPASLNSTGLM